MNFEQLQIKLDDFIKHYRIAILGTLLAHTFFVLILVAFEIAKPIINVQNSVSIEFEPEPPLPQNTETEQNNVQNNNDNNLQNVKNISSNDAEKNKSFNDYYKEAENMVNNTKAKDNFTANDYADKRYLAKDYSKDNSFFTSEANSNKEQNSTHNNNSASKSTYAGNAIITYNLKGRKAVRLPVPAYQCLGSGTVVIEVNVNNLGVVKSASIISSNTSLNEECLSNAALKAAQNSKFEIDLNSQPITKGTINYKFIGQ